MKSRLPHWLWLFLLLGSYSIIAIIITYPLINNLETHLVGRTTDALLHYWNNWWVQKALTTGQNPFFTTYLSYPYGVSLITHNFAWFNILPWLLLEPLLGGIVAYNVIILLSLVLCGLSMYWLAFDLLHDQRAAFIAGLIYMAWPFRLSQLDHPNLVATYFMPIFFLFLGRTLRNGRWRDAIFAGISAAMVGYTRWQILIPAFLMALVYILGLSPQWWQQKRHTFPKLITVGLLGFFLLLPPAIMLGRAQLQSDVTADVLYATDEQIMNTDWLAYITPPRRHPQFKSIVNPIYDEHYYPDRSKGRRYPAYIGISVLILVAIALIKRWRDTWIWLLMALLLMLLASGMAWRFNGQLYTAIPTLYKLLGSIASLMREPERFVMFLALPVAIMAAYGWQVILSKVRKKLWAILLTVGLSLLILFEYAVYPTQMQAVNFDKTIFNALAKLDGEFAVLNLPPRYRFSKDEMFAQTIHERPILQGHVSREPDNLYQFMQENAWFDDLATLSDPGYLMAQLYAANINYVIVAKDCSANDLAYCLWAEHMPVDAVYEDARYLVYATRPATAVSQQLTSGLALSSTESSLLCTPHHKQLSSSILWTTTATLEADFHVRLSAAVANGRYQTEPQPLHATWPTSQWPPGTFTQQAYTLVLPVDAKIESLSAQIINSQNDAVLTSADLQLPECDISTTDTTLVEATFGETLKLLEYNFDYDQNDLHLTLYWLAVQRPIENLKIFVYVLDATDNVVAQVDTLPKNWTYPTVLWHTGELVTDPITVPLTDLPPGAYKVAIGVYKEETGVRLPLSATNSPLKTLADNRLLLPQQIILE